MLSVPAIGCLVASNIHKGCCNPRQKEGSSVLVDESFLKVTTLSLTQPSVGSQNPFVSDKTSTRDIRVFCELETRWCLVLNLQLCLKSLTTSIFIDCITYLSTEAQ